MGVFCVDRSGVTAFGTSGLLWSLTGQVLLALGAPRADTAWTRDGYVPSWVARAWGDALFTDLGDAVLVCRPAPGRLDQLQPVGTYRRGSPDQAAWARAGEHLSVYDTPVATVLLLFAQTCTGSNGYTVTTLRPPAPGSPRSDVAVRTLLRRSGVLTRTVGRLSTGTRSPVRRTPA